ncbi:MAG: ABC transporter ATP-binding protein [Spirochaetaceae bacterium]|nr:ABC transporter ATP-binding protein [Spirochaetaceae bacterium]
MTWLRDALRARRELLLAVKRQVRLLRGAVATLVGVRALLVALALIPPLLIREFVDGVVVAGSASLLPWLLGAFGLVYVAETGAMVVERSARNRMLAGMTVRLRHRNFAAALRKPSSAGSGDLKRAVEEDVEQIGPAFDSHVIQATFVVVRIAALAVLLVILSWHLALISLVVSVIVTFAVGFFSKGAKHVGATQRAAMGNFDDWLHESIRRWRETKALQLERRELAAMRRQYEPVQHAMSAAQFYFWGAEAVGRAVDRLAAQALLYFIGALLIFGGFITAGVLLAFVRYYVAFAEAIQELRASDVSFQASRAPIRRALDLGADLPSRSALRAEYASTSRKRALPPAIVAKRISFGKRLPTEARTGEPILDRIDLSVPGNAFLSIVGESGSGKTTLARVLSGELAADSGSVLVGGAPIQSLSERERFDTFAYVGDDSTVLNISVRENLLLADAALRDQELRRALEIVVMNDEVEAMDDGLDTLIGERGTKLSGGQRQRLLLARAILSDRPILMLDEATSQVDPRTDARVHDSLQRLRSRKSVITISHRLSTVLNAHSIAVIARGRLVATGTHADLLESNAEYRRLFAGQDEDGSDHPTGQVPV